MYRAADEVSIAEDGQIDVMPELGIKIIAAWRQSLLQFATRLNF